MDFKHSWIINKFIAHRGLHTNNEVTPENSLPSFEAAIREDFAIELDVHLTTDEKVVVFHDDNLKRMTGLDKITWNCSYSEIKKLSLSDSEFNIPTLEEVLEITRGRVPLLIEIKNKGKVGLLEKNVYEALKKYDGLYAIQSFNPFSMDWFKIQAPEIIRGQLSGSFENEKLPVYKKTMLRNLLFNKRSSPSFINYDINCIPNWALNKARKDGLWILGWTAKTKKEFVSAKKYCDNVLFEGFNPRSKPPHS